LVVALLLEVITSTVAADTGGRVSGPQDTTFPAVPSTKARFTGPTHAPVPPPAAPTPYQQTPEYTKEYTTGYTKEYTDKWEETKTYVHPHSYTKSYEPYHTPSVPSLEDALINAGCSKFLAFIKSDVDTWALYNSARVRTVFAPDDVSFDSNTTTHARLRRRELTPEEQQQADLSADAQLTDLSKLRIVPGTVVETNDNSANLLGSAQVVVSEVDDATGAVKIASGLGNEVNLKTSDIQYTNGLIHTTSGLLTNPELLSLTLLTNPDLSTFGSLLAGVGKSNLTRRDAPKLDLTPRITVFIPTNEAFSGISITANQAAAVLDGHTIVSNSLAVPVGYLPELKNGQTFKTEGGGSVAISVRGGATYVGGAKILQANIILPNGVAHVVDKVLAQPVQTGAAVPGMLPGAGRAALVAAGVVAMALPSW